MNSTESLILQVAIAVQANTPILLIGEPGVAKTGLVHGIARSLGWPCVEKIASMHDPTDFSGLPHMGKDGVELLAFKWARELSAEKIGNRPAIVFLDELNLAQHSTMAAAFKLIHEGRVGDTQLGPRVARVAAMNPAEISNVPQILPALGNRFCQLNWVMTPEYWINATLAGYPDPQVPRLPEDWENNVPLSSAMVTGFVQANQQQAHARPDNEANWAKPWPSFRTWTMAFRLLAACQAIGVGDGIEAGLVEGCVGSGAAMAFMAYRREMKLPNPEDVLKNPTKTKYPKKGDQLYVLLNSVVSAVLNNNTEERWMAAWEVMVEAAKDKMDIATASARALAKGRKPTYGTPKKVAMFYEALNMAGIARNVVDTKKTAAA